MKKNATEINLYLRNIQNRIVKDMAQMQQKIAKEICDDVKNFAPSETGKYKESINVSETVVKDNVIETSITTNATVKAKSNGNVYNLGYLLENGTLEHAIPNAWGKGYFYGYVDRFGYWHKGTLDKDWHPGFRPFPHFIPALLLNKENYLNKIGETLDKEFK